MDILSHGLWGALAFGKRSYRLFLLSFLLGIAPDLISFGFFSVGTWTGFFDHPDWSSGDHPPADAFPVFVYALYQYTHSLVVFSVIFGLVWIILRRPWWPLGAWGLHILVDIPTHTDRFFPTPFLWPLSDFHVNGIPWSHPSIFIPNVVLLLVLYSWFLFLQYEKRRKRTTQATLQAKELSIKGSARTPPFS